MDDRVPEEHPPVAEHQAASAAAGSGAERQTPTEVAAGDTEVGAAAGSTREDVGDGPPAEEPVALDDQAAGPARTLGAPETSAAGGEADGPTVGTAGPPGGTPTAGRATTAAGSSSEPQDLTGGGAPLAASPEVAALEVGMRGEGGSPGPPEEYFGVSAAPVPRPDDQSAAQAYDAVVEVDLTGQAELSAALAATLEAHRGNVAAERSRIDEAEAAQLTAVEQAFRAAQQRVAQAVRASRSGLAQTGTTTRAEVKAQHSTRTTSGLAMLTGAAARVERAGADRGAEAVTSGTQAATTVRAQVGEQSAQAHRRGEAKLPSLHGPSPEATRAMRAAVQEVASQSAREIGDSLGATEADLRAAGPELRAALGREATQAAQHIRQHAQPLRSTLQHSAVEADRLLATAAAGGTAEIDQTGRAVTASLSELLATVRRSVQQQAAAGRTALDSSARTTEAALTDEGRRALTAGRDATTVLLGQMTSRPVRRAVARQLSESAARTLRQNYGLSSARARAIAGQISSEFTRAADAVHTSLAETAQRAGSQAGETALAAGQEAADAQRRLAGQLTSLMQQSVSRADHVVSATSGPVLQSTADVEQGFGRAVADLRTRLGQHGDEAQARAASPLGTLDDRMQVAAGRARDREEDGWLVSQLKDAWEALTPGFIASLVVGLLVTIAVVAICGTGIGALILAGAVAGASSALMSNATDYAFGTGRYAHGEQWSWSAVGTEMALGAAFGAAGGALGAGVTGAIGARTGSTVVNAVARRVFTQAATQQAVGKVSNVVLGVGLGVAQNVVSDGMQHGWDHALDNWDRGLLLNAAVSAVMVSDAVGGRMQHATESARGAMVDRGMAFNVTPAEFTAAQGRLAARAGVDAPAPAAGDAGASTGAVEAIEASTARDMTEAAGRTPVQEQIEAAAGIDRGPRHEQSMADLRAFYENQQREAATSTDVRNTRIDPMVDSSGNPSLNPDGTPYGYGVEQGFEVRQFDYGPGGRLTEVTMKVQLRGGPGLTPAELVQVRRNVHAGVEQYYNNGQRLPNGDRLHVTVEFVSDPASAHLNVEVHPGSGPTVQNRWYAADNPTTLAHELGHQLGFLDEYVDARTLNRRTPTATGVTHDGSLMGDYWMRDASGHVPRDSNGRPMVDPDVGLRDRHLEQLGSDIDAARSRDATGQSTTTTPPSPGQQETSGSSAQRDRRTAGASTGAPRADALEPLGVDGAEPRTSPGARSVPAAAPAPAGRAQADHVEALTRRSQQRVAEIEDALAVMQQELAEEQARHADLRRQLIDGGVDLSRLDNERFVAQLPPELAAIARERAELIRQIERSHFDIGRANREIARWERAPREDMLVERYARLRSLTPDQVARARVASAAADVVGKARSESNPLQPDHIVPVMEIMGMDNFLLLDDDVALRILNTPENIEPLNRAANASKSDWSWSEWPQWAQHTSPSVRARQIARETQLRQTIYDEIQREFARLMRR